MAAWSSRAPACSARTCTYMYMQKGILYIYKGILYI